MGVDEWMMNIPVLKAIIDKHGPVSVEREFQQVIMRENNQSPVSNATDYFVIDIEYADSEYSSRFDMIAVKWLSTSSEHKNRANKRLAFIEVKYGDKELAKKSGIVEHIQDMRRFLSGANRLAELCNEMKVIFNQKVKLGLCTR